MYGTFIWATWGARRMAKLLELQGVWAGYGQATVLEDI